MVLAIKSKNGIVLDHFNIKCILSANDQNCPKKIFYELQEELVSAILRLSLLASQLPKAPADCSWSLLVITNDINNTSELENAPQRNVIQAALSSGEWMVDNSHLTEQAVVSSNV